MPIPSIQDAVGWLGYFFIGYTAYLVAFTILKRRRPKHAERWMKFLVTLRKVKKKIDGLSELIPVWELVLIVCLSVMVYAATRR